MGQTRPLHVPTVTSCRERGQASLVPARMGCTLRERLRASPAGAEIVNGLMGIQRPYLNEKTRTVCKQVPGTCWKTVLGPAGSV